MKFNTKFEKFSKNFRKIIIKDKCADFGNVGKFPRNFGKCRRLKFL